MIGGQGRNAPRQGHVGEDGLRQFRLLGFRQAVAEELLVGLRHGSRPRDIPAEGVLVHPVAEALLVGVGAGGPPPPSGPAPEGTLSRREGWASPKSSRFIVHKLAFTGDSWP